MRLPYVYRVTKYDPADRDDHGHYTGSEDVVSDHGEVEAAYLRAIAAFAADTGVDHLTVREPQVPSYVHFGAEPPVDGYGLTGLFPAGPTGFFDGAEVTLKTGLELVRAMLRDNGAWCRLEGGGHVRAVAGEDAFPELTARISRAKAAALLPMYADEWTPLCTAVMPDSDGVVRARWQTDPTPVDRTWAEQAANTPDTPPEPPDR